MHKIVRIQKKTEIFDYIKFKRIYMMKDNTPKKTDWKKICSVSSKKD